MQGLYVCGQVSKERLRAVLLICYSEAYVGQKSHGMCANLVDEEVSWFQLG